MKRLMSMSGLTGKAKEREAGGASTSTATKSSERVQAGDEPDDVFKLPSKPSRQQDGVGADAGAESGEADKRDAAAARQRLPRKQERPRPLPRGDSSAAGIPDALKRRVVSLGKKPAARKKTEVAAPRDEEGTGTKRKRKSLSPKSAPLSVIRPERPY